MMKHDFKIGDVVVAKEDHITMYNENFSGKLGKVIRVREFTVDVKFSGIEGSVSCWFEEVKHFRIQNEQEPTITLGGLGSQSERTNVIYLSDSVDSPSHYADRPVEVIEIIRSTLTKEQFEGFCLGNLLKYNMRAGLKGNAQEDYKKGEKYYNWYKESVDSGSGK